jgi:hypothetical protein
MPTAQEYQTLIQSQYFNVIQDNTDLSQEKLQHSTCFNHIWLSADTKALLTRKQRIVASMYRTCPVLVVAEQSGVIRDNLSSMWIPAGWKWGGLVSEHCPIWTEFNIV